MLLGAATFVYLFLVLFSAAAFGPLLFTFLTLQHLLLTLLALQA